METVTRLRGTPILDPYSGKPTGIDWTNPDALPIDGCVVWDGGSDEPLETGGTPVLSDFKASLPYGADVTARDRVIIRGLTCEIVGRPFDWENPFTGWQAGRVIAAKIKEG